MSDIFDEIKDKGEGDIFDTIPEVGSRPISTVTGKPVPTPEEEWGSRKQGYQDLRKAAGVALPIAGDIAGTVAAQMIPGLNVAKGAGMAAKYGPRALNLGKRMLGAGLGGFGGSVAGQQVEKGEIDWEEARQHGILGAGGEGAMSVAGAPVKWLGQKVGRHALELMGDITYSGSIIKNKLRRKLVDDTTEDAIKFVNDVAPDIVKKQNVGVDDLGIMVNSALDESRLLYGTYEGVLEEFAKKQGGKIPLDDTAQFLGNLLKKTSKEMAERTGKEPSSLAITNAVLREMGYTPKTGFELKKLLADELATPEQIKYLLATVFKKGKGDFFTLAPSQRSAREELKTALLDDIGRVKTGDGKTARVLKEEADQVFKSVKQFESVKKLFDGGISTDPATGRRRLLPYKVADNIYGAEGKIKKDMPELWPKLKEKADFFREIAPQFEKESTQMMTGLGQVASRTMGGAGGYLALGPWGIPVAETLGAISAYSVFDPARQKLIANALKWSAKAPAKAGVHLGGEEVVFE